MLVPSSPERNVEEGWLEKWEGIGRSGGGDGDLVRGGNEWEAVSKLWVWQSDMPRAAGGGGFPSFQLQLLNNPPPPEANTEKEDCEKTDSYETGH
jgi:hypothetical protein